MIKLQKKYTRGVNNALKKAFLHHYLFLCLVAFCLLFTSCRWSDKILPTGTKESSVPEKKNKKNTSISVRQLPKYSGEPYVKINGGQPDFTEQDKMKESFEQYSELDSLGRCGAAFANIGRELMPTEERGNIGKIKPAGWHTVKYDSVDGKYLYNRCHLIGYQLTAENANKRNLITGTRYMNVEGMLLFENQVADHIKETGNHVLYRVTPIFDGRDLLARGVQMEAYSIEDEGHGVCFNVFVYNVQPGIRIDYATGASKEESGKGAGTVDARKTAGPDTDGKNEQEGADKNTGHIIIRGNKKSKIYHCPGQASYDEMADSEHLVIFHSEREALDAGYRKAKR